MDTDDNVVRGGVVKGEFMKLLQWARERVWCAFAAGAVLIAIGGWLVYIVLSEVVGSAIALGVGAIMGVGGIFLVGVGFSKIAKKVEKPVESLVGQLMARVAAIMVSLMGAILVAYGVYGWYDQIANPRTGGFRGLGLGSVVYMAITIFAVLVLLTGLVGVVASFRRDRKAAATITGVVGVFAIVLMGLALAVVWGAVGVWVGVIIGIGGGLMVVGVWLEAGERRRQQVKEVDGDE